MRRSLLLWVVAWALTLGSAVWQRRSGPTYPVRVRTEEAGMRAHAQLLRSHSVKSGLPVAVEALDPAVTGGVIWRRHPTADSWSELPLARDGDRLVAILPAQPKAGKIAYRVVLRRADTATGSPTVVTLPQGDPVVARFKGDVPLPLLIVHVLAIFAAMLYASRAGLEALARGPRLRRYVAVATALMLGGGMILGPLVQRAVFDAYWTGWPLGRDLTDNKVAVTMVLWLMAWLRGRRGRGGRDARGWAVAAAAVTLVIFVVPHSLLGSEFDYAAAPPPGAG